MCFLLFNSPWLLKYFKNVKDKVNTLLSFGNFKLDTRDWVIPTIQHFHCKDFSESINLEKQSIIQSELTLKKGQKIKTKKMQKCQCF